MQITCNYIILRCVCDIDHYMLSVHCRYRILVKMILVVKKQLKHAVANKAQKNSEASTVINNNLGLLNTSVMILPTML